jgi:REP element-mobilizing transposase RayT
MSTHFQHTAKKTYYFVTFTCYRWLYLIEKSNVFDYLPGWIMELNKRGIINCGYVFMPNHIHLLVYVEDWSKGLNLVIGEAKRFLAYEIVRRLKAQNEKDILKALSQGVREIERKKGKKHQVFRLSFDGKEVVGEKDICSVLDYIHNNPVSGKWNLAGDYLKYEYSNARFYEFGEVGTFKIRHFREVLESSEFPADNSEGG